MSKLTASPDISAFLASSTKTQARTNIGFDSSPIVVSNITARKTSGSYVDGPQVGATRVIQTDTPNIVWHLIATDITNDNSWIGQPYTSDSSGIIDVDLEISDVSAVIPNVGVIGRVGKNLTLGDGKTVGGYRIDTAVRGNQLAITVIDPAGDGALSGYALTTIPVEWRALANSLTVAHVGTNVTTIGNSAFVYCTSLSSVTIGDSVTSIGSYAFYYCTSLTSITIPDSVTSIGSSAFSSCTSLTSITIGDSVTSIGSSAFAYCSSLTAITIPDSVTSIGSSAFSSCTSLTSVTIPDSVTSIGSNAFAGCTSLTSITIPDSVTSIGSSAFAYCSSLASVTIGDSVTSIGINAFRSCTSLASVNSLIPKTVWDTSVNALTNTALPLTIHALAGDASWTAGTGLTVAGNTNVTVIKDL
jgi:hypothetical protein